MSVLLILAIVIVVLLVVVLVRRNGASSVIRTEPIFVPGGQHTVSARAAHQGTPAMGMCKMLKRESAMNTWPKERW